MRSNEERTILLVASPGGHLRQLIHIASGLRGFRLHYVTYRSPLGQSLENRTLLRHYGDTLSRLLLTMINATISAPLILARERPAVLISTGAEIAIPFFFLATLFGVPTIFVESLARVRSPSGTGRVVYHIASRFYVQWSNLTTVYGPKAQFKGGLLA